MWRGRPVVVAGAAVAGAAAARALLRREALVTVIDRKESAATAELAAAGARVVIGDDPPAGLFDGVTDLVVSPGFAPHHPLVAAAQAAGVEVYSEPELAWRLREPGAPAWLAITGTNGKTTTVTMLAAILAAAGHRTAAVGNIGEPLVDLTGYDVLAVELSSQQLHWSSRLAPQVGALLNLAPDHLEWHGSFEAYVEAKTAIWRAAAGTGDLAGTGESAGTGEPSGTAVGNLDDPLVAARLAGVGFTLAEPKPGQLGVIDGVLVDHAFAGSPVELIGAAAVRPPGEHNVANALAAAAVARAYGVPPGAVRAGLAGYQPQPHRNARVAEVAGVTYVDDSKATNPHAALASLLAYPRVVWIAGGQLKGVAVGELVRTVADRLAGAVLLGIDRAELARELARYAPDLPVVEVADPSPAAMDAVVRAAADLAAPGDVVLLAPAAASKDMFTGYEHRGEAFAAAVHALVASRER
ncbi:MAG TPA: UDP-N-acetylmuramoyl-L-alanine--D-glutamate ligase [Natronosporangium sp.]